MNNEYERYDEWGGDEYEDGPSEASEQGMSRQERVSNIRNYLDHAQMDAKASGHAFDPLMFLSDSLNRECWAARDRGERYGTEGHGVEGYARFFGELQMAWDALIYDRITHEKEKKEIRSDFMARRYRRRKDGMEPEDGPIVLEYPLQRDVLDAMAQAVGIPYKRGQSEIPFPAELKRVSVQEVVFDATARAGGDSRPYTHQTGR